MPELFWNFSARTYSRADVPEACIALQEERGVDVNMLLFCLWYACGRGPMPAEVLQAVLEFSEAWASAVVRPLRQVRTWMKAGACQQAQLPLEACMVLRERVKGIELSAEKIQQEALESTVAAIAEESQTLPDQLEAAVNNIYRYFTKAKIDIDDFTLEKLGVILHAGISGPSARDIQQALHRQS